GEHAVGNGSGLQVEDGAAKPGGRVRIKRRALDDIRRKGLDGAAVEIGVVVVQAAVGQSQRNEIGDGAAGSRDVRVDLAALDRPLSGGVAIDVEATAGSIGRVAVYLAISYGELARA